jgi:hypothetical protein
VEDTERFSTATSLTLFGDRQGAPASVHLAGILLRSVRCAANGSETTHRHNLVEYLTDRPERATIGTYDDRRPDIVRFKSQYGLALPTHSWGPVKESGKCQAVSQSIDWRHL